MSATAVRPRRSFVARPASASRRSAPADLVTHLLTRIARVNAVNPALTLSKDERQQLRECEARGLVYALPHGRYRCTDLGLTLLRH